MSLQEQLEKVQSESDRKLKNEEKNCKQKEKELLTKLELEEARAAAKRMRKSERL